MNRNSTKYKTNSKLGNCKSSYALLKLSRYKVLTMVNISLSFYLTGVFSVDLTDQAGYPRKIPGRSLDTAAAGLVKMNGKLIDNTKQINCVL